MTLIRHASCVLLLALPACRTSLEHVRPKHADSGSPAAHGTPDIHLNEVRSDRNPFLEVVNIGTGSADLAGWRVVIDGTCEQTLSTTASVSAGGYLALWAGGALTCPIERSGSATLYSAEGAIIDELSWEAPFAANSWCRMPDATGAFTTCAQYTPGEENTNNDTPNTVEPVWVWRYEGRVNALAEGTDHTVWASQPLESLLSRVALDDAATVATVDMSHVPEGDDGEAGWRGLVTLTDGTVMVSDRLLSTVSVVDPTTGALTPWTSTATEGAPTDLGRLDDGGIVVTMADDIKVACYNSDGSLRWVQAASETVPMASPRNVVPMADHVVVIDRELRHALLFHGDDGTFLGTISGRMSDVSTDDEPGRVNDRIRGGAWSATHQILFLSDYSGGRILGFDTSDLDTLVDEDQAWGYIGEMGEFGEGDTDFGSPRTLLALPDTDLLLVVDRGNDRVMALGLDDTVAALQP